MKRNFNWRNYILQKWKYYNNFVSLRTRGQVGSFSERFFIEVSKISPGRDKLSVYLFALVRILRTSAFFLFQFVFEKSNKEPSLERIRSERGREDKPITLVLYSMREGGDFFGTIFFR